MDIDELLEKVLQLPEEWEITCAELFEQEKRVDVHVAHVTDRGPCPDCGTDSPKYDVRPRRWRHLDLCDHQTWIVCSVPRINCTEHGVRQVHVPWADGWSRFTAQFECKVIDWLKDASVMATARNMGLSWPQVNRIQERAVARGLARRGSIAASRIGVDETSFQKRHEYVTIVNDLDSARVLHVTDGRGQESLASYFEQLQPEERTSIDIVAMDMHAPYIHAAARFVPGLADKICFDRFHVAQHFAKAVDKERRAENKRLLAEGDDALKGSKYLWLRRFGDMPRKLRAQLAALREQATALAEIWAVKEAASKLWHYRSKTWATKAWIALCEWAESLGSVALNRVADLVLRHLIGIVNAIVHRVTNASAESINSRVQAIKRRANGYRCRDRFRNAILFHLGGLDLYPRPTTHTNA